MKAGLMLIASMLFATNGFTQTRKPEFAGQWYPDNKQKLYAMLDNFFQKVDLPDNIRGITPFGLISPHAGFIYSGQVAAYAYSTIQGKQYDLVILLGCSHHYLNNTVSIYDGDYYKTPLGKVPIARDIVKQILDADKNFLFQEGAHSIEHSLEAQIPFLQYALSKESAHDGNDFSIVPILIMTRDTSLLNKLANTLTHIVEDTKKNILFVVSTDMSHFHPYDQAVEMDRRTIDMIVNNETDKLENAISDGSSELCGYWALDTFQRIARNVNANKITSLKYQNSGDVSGDKSRVVGYTAIVFAKSSEYKSDEEELGQEEKKFLLDLARRSIRYYLDKKEMLAIEPPKQAFLNKERAVFVTLRKNGQLRGCIGQMIAQDKLYKAIIEMAVSAAVKDYRFTPVKLDELDDISIEISILTPLKRIDNIDEIVLGRDGVYVKKGFHTGVYLPQVATETGWSKEEFLRSLCSHKAGLLPNAYLDKDTELYIFQVIKFEE